MASDPYVNNIPTMTGGVGVEELTRFYKHHFINSNPEDTQPIRISSVDGTDRTVDEILFCFTHDREIDWMLRGIAPGGKPVKIPFVAIVTFRDGKLCHGRIYWDQASVLIQIGLLDGTNLPIAGIETANKLLDKNFLSNTLMKRCTESANRSQIKDHTF
ncbi:hypothetical protein I4U23_018826 [Adineta vaga]|nr:hypothetical protein I4U23_018826 [Adineta vaga]